MQFVRVSTPEHANSLKDHMSHQPTVLAFTGSLRQGSHNHRLLRLGIEHLQGLGASVTEIELRTLGLPMFDEDLESELIAAGKPMPEGVVKLQDLMIAHDTLLIATPEYNGSITPALKNAIDWCSRRVDEQGPLACYRGKVAGLMSASPGKLGGVRGLPETRRILSGIGVQVVPGDFACPSVHETVPAEGTPAEFVASGIARLCDTALGVSP